MKHLVLGLVLALLAVTLASATTTDQLKIISGADTCIINDNGTTSGSCGTIGADTDPTAGSISVGGDLNGWHLRLTGGVSNSPNTMNPVVGIDLSGQVSTCTGASGVGCSTNALQLLFTDMNFAIPPKVGDFTFADATTVQNTTNTGNATAKGYYDQGNVNFAETTLIDSVTFTTSDGTNTKINTGGVPVAPFSLTVDDIFNPVATGVTYNPGTSLTADPVPEPASIAFFGSVLALCASRLRRRKSA